MLLISAETAAVAAIICALASVASLVAHGAGTSPLIGRAGMGVSIRFDVVNAAMLLLVAFIGWIVVRYAATFLDGAARQGAFVGWLCLTIVCVLMLVLAGNLAQLVAASIATSLARHRLLLFHPERVAARRAARKKFVTARIGDAALIGAAALLAIDYGAGDIAMILHDAREGLGGGFTIAAAGLLAVAAC